MTQPDLPVVFGNEVLPTLQGYSTSQILGSLQALPPRSQAQRFLGALRAAKRGTPTAILIANTHLGVDTLEERLLGEGLPTTELVRLHQEDPTKLPKAMIAVESFLPMADRRLALAELLAAVSLSWDLALGSSKASEGCFRAATWHHRDAIEYLRECQPGQIPGITPQQLQNMLGCIARGLDCGSPV